MTARLARSVAMAVVLPLAACAGGSDDPDVPDAGTPGRAETDLVPMDGVVLDVAALDAGAPDGGVPATELPRPEGLGDHLADIPVFDDSAGSTQDGASSPPAVGEPSDAMLDGEVAFRRLESRVATEVVDARNHESWFCTGMTRRTEYRFILTSDGMRRGAELDGRGGLTPVEFGWAAVGAHTLLLDYREVGRQVELGSILFAGDDALRANDGASGPLECRRQRYVEGAPTRDVTVVAPEDVDPDVEAAAALAGRMETSRVADGSFDYWYCEVTDGRAVGYVFAGEGVLGPDRRAVAFDVGLQGMTAPDIADVDGEQGARRPGFDPQTDDGRPFRWLATDGTTLVLVPLDAEVMLGATEVETTALDGIAFLVDDAFTARRTDGALLQCLREGDA